MAVINRNNATNSWTVKSTGVTVSGRIKEYDTYQEMLDDQYPGIYAWVFDASGDPTVESGAAYYVYNDATSTWVKLYETECMDREQQLGWFPTVAALREAYPIGQAGWCAVIGETNTIWVWDVVNQDWRDSSPSASAIDSLASAISTVSSGVSSSITSMNSTLTSTVSAVDSAVVKVSSAVSEVSAMSSQVTSVASQVSTVTSSVDSNTSAISNLSATMILYEYC